MVHNIESLERRLQFASITQTLTSIPFEPKLRDGGVLVITGGDASEGVRVAQVRSASQIDSEPWQSLLIPVEKGTGAVIPGSESDNATGKVVGESGGPYIRVSTPGKSWFFRAVNVNRISLGTNGGNDLIAMQRDLRKRVNVDAGNDADIIYGARFRSLLAGGAGNDTIFAGQSNDTLEGGAGHDALVGDAGDDLLLGGDGNDTLKGGFGTDLLYGGDGDDELNGEFGGSDNLFGNDGNDVLILKDQPGNRDFARGGGGRDTILFLDADDLFLQ